MNKGWMALPLVLALTACGEKEPAQTAAAPQKAVAGDPQADCAALGKAWFDAAHGAGTKAEPSGRETQTSYRAHHDTTGQRCLIRVEDQVAAQGDAPAITSVRLFLGDPKAKRLLGAVARIGDRTPHCVLDDRNCTSLDAWNALVEPLMSN